MGLAVGKQKTESSNKKLLISQQMVGLAGA
jgi:hypothetical protein